MTLNVQMQVKNEKKKFCFIYKVCMCQRYTYRMYTCTCASAYPVVYLKLHVPYAMLCMHLYVLISRKLIECFRHELSLFVNADKIQNCFQGAISNHNLIPHTHYFQNVINISVTLFYLLIYFEFKTNLKRNEEYNRMLTNTTYYSEKIQHCAIW